MISCKGEELHAGESGTRVASAKTITERKLLQPSQASDRFGQVVEAIQDLFFKRLIPNRVNVKFRFIHATILLSK
jgi:hypothetical protein